MVLVKSNKFFSFSGAQNILILFCILLFISCKTFASNIDTLHNLKGRVSNFVATDVFIKTTNGDTVNLGFINHFDSITKKPLDVEIVRIDITNHTATYKTVAGVPSYNTGFAWRYVMDKDYNIYYSVGYVGTVLKINLDIGIDVKNLGNPFTNKHYVYSLSIGANGNIFIGSMDGATEWAELVNDSLILHPAVNGQAYVLDIHQLGDNIYVATGQKGFTGLYAVNKTNNSNTELARLSTGKRFNFYNTGSHIYLNYIDSSNPATYRWFELINITMLPVSEPQNDPMRIGFYTLPHCKATYQKTNNKLYISRNDGAVKTAYDITSGFTGNAIRKFWSYENDTMNIYFQGDYYDDIYRYNFTTQQCTDLASPNYNIYSSLQINDSITWLGSYPNGTVLSFNKNNPSHITTVAHLRDSTGMHHVRKMISIGNKIICAGDVIRVANTAGIGDIDMNTKQVRAVNYYFFRNLTYSGLAKWSDKAVLSTSGNDCALFIYDPATHYIIDSIRLAGFGNYGDISINKNILTGITLTSIYTIDLTTRKLLSQVVLNAVIKNHYVASNGQIFLQTNATNVPAEFTVLNFDLFFQFNNSILGRDGYNIYRIHDVPGKSAY